MDTSWIPIFVLMLTECVAPAGKTVCQEQSFELQFLSRSDCEFALQQFVTLKGASETVIVDKSKSSCVPSARQQKTFANVADVAESVGDKQGWIAPDVEASASGSSRKMHNARLENLVTCEKSKGVAPCKIGEIIIEDATDGDPIEIWRHNQD